MAWVANESEPTVSWGSLWLLGTVLLSAWALSWSGGFYDRPALLAYGLISVGLLVSARQAVTPKRPPIDRVSWNAVLHVAFLAQALLVVVTRIPLLGLGAWGRPLLLDVTNPALSRWVTALSYVVIALVLAQHPHLVRRLPRRVVSGMRAGTVACVCVIFLLVPRTSVSPPVDVFVFQQESAQALIRGDNPYRVEYTNLYGANTPYYPAGEARYYPYPPASLLAALTSLVTGDVRWLSALSHLAAGLLLYLGGRTRGLGSTEAYYLALLFVHMPVGPFIIEQAYTDTNVVFALALFSYCFARSAMTLALLSAGLALALKQTMAVFLIFVFPILWPALAFGEYCVLLALSVASYGIFLIADAWSLIEDVAYFHLATPFRDDGLTLSSLLYRLRGVPLPAVASPIALLTGAVGWGVYTFGLNTRSVDPRFSARRLASVWVGFASTFLLVLLFSKHAFANYFYVVHGTLVLVLALLWSRIADEAERSRSTADTVQAS